MAVGAGPHNRRPPPGPAPRSAIGKYLLTFHGATPRGRRERAHHGEASIDIAWSDDLMHWHWPGNPTGHRAAVTKPGQDLVGCPFLLLAIDASQAPRCSTGRRSQSRMRILDSSTIQSRPSSSSGRDRRNRAATCRTWSRVWLLRRNTTIPEYSRGGYVRMSAKSVSSVTIARRSRTHADATFGSVAPPSLWSRTVDASCPASPNRFASSAGRFSSSLKRMWVV